MGTSNKLIRFDTFQVALQYLSYALIGKRFDTFLTWAWEEI